MRELLEAQWNKPGVAEGAALCIWRVNGSGLEHDPGESRDVSRGANAWLRKQRKHWGPPPPAKYEGGAFTVPKWLRERYKQNCPRNYKALCRYYGVT